MTLPDEAHRAILQARLFLARLLDPRQTPRVPRAIRNEVHGLLKHYPVGDHGLREVGQVAVTNLVRLGQMEQPEFEPQAAPVEDPENQLG